MNQDWDVVLINWQEVSVKLDKIAVEAVSEILVDCGAAGVSIEDPDMIRERIAENTWDAYEFPDEVVNRDYVRIAAYFPCDIRLEERIDNLKSRLRKLNQDIFPGSIEEIILTEVQEEDWANSWKAYYKPVKAGQRIVIKPTWEDYVPESGEIVIELDPGMAFGTGTHPTTVMCIRALEELVIGGETVFDVGTGSGILAITAAKLGAKEVKAVDIDLVAVKAASENAALNKADDIVEVMAGNLLDKVRGQADLVIANIVADVIKIICPDAAKAVKPGGRFLTSGIIAPRGEEVKKAIIGAGFMIEKTVREGDWLCFIASRED